MFSSPIASLFHFFNRSPLLPELQWQIGATTGEALLIVANTKGVTPKETIAVLRQISIAYQATCSRRWCCVVLSKSTKNVSSVVKQLIDVHFTPLV